MQTLTLYLCRPEYQSLKDWEINAIGEEIREYFEDLLPGNYKYPHRVSVYHEQDWYDNVTYYVEFDENWAFYDRDSIEGTVYINKVSQIVTRGSYGSPMGYITVSTDPNTEPYDTDIELEDYDF